MATSRPTNIDSPTLDDRLGFDLYARGIARTIRDASFRNQLPLTIGIYGRWGSGKTSLMKMVEAELVGSTASGMQTDFEAQLLQRGIRGLWLIHAVWALLLVAGVALGPWTTAFLHVRFHVSPEAAAFGYLWALLALLGGLVRGIFATWWQGYIEKELDSIPILIATRGPQGLLVGLACLTLLTYGPVVLQRVLHSNFLLVTGYVLACIVGVFAREIIRAPVRIWSRFRSISLGAGPVSPSPQYQVIWFDAWKYAQEDELWATLLQRLLTELKVNAEGSKRVRIKWELWKRSIEWRSGALDIAKKLLPTVGKLGAALAVGGIAFWLSRLLWPETSPTQVTHAASTAAGLLSTAGALAAWLRTNVATPLADVDFEKYRKKASYRDHLTFLTEFGEELKAIVTVARNVGNPVVLMLDDLDRCLPEQAVSVLEAIKLFVSDEAPIIFVVGADREFIERAIDVMYAALKDKDDPYESRRERFAQLGREYLEKIVQLPFNLPPIEPRIVHIVAPNGANFLSGDQFFFPTTSSGAIPGIKIADLGAKLQTSGVRLILLDIPESRAVARELARYVPAVVGIQVAQFAVDPAFAAAFYTAFLRTGQADFAITEGRRTIWSSAAASNAPGSYVALAPVLYQSPGSGLIFEPLTASPLRPAVA